jgi:hypothetical protein
MFISSFLQGGLGNQMFQIAHAVSVADKLGVKACFNKKAYTPMQARQPSAYEDNIFKYVSFAEFEEVDCEIIEESMLSFLTEKDLAEIVKIKPILFHGYFQSQEYFSDRVDETFGLFDIENFISFQDLKSKLPEITESYSVAVHLRRGDYLSISSILPVIDISYIKEALSRIPNVQRVFIFSDDKEFAKSLDIPNSLCVEGFQDYEELALMSICPNNIISNSSFSWWSSFLNGSDNKRVFAPSLWLGPNATPFPRPIHRPEMEIIPVQYREGFLYV